MIGISGKDRGAILPAGKTGTAYMYMGASGQFASSTFYMKQHPAWVDAFNARKPADRYFKTEWKPLLPEAAYARSLPDSQPWFGPRGGKLPMMMGVAADDAPGPAFYAALLRSPFADVLSLEFARAAIAGEQLGRDDAPDILAVSLSGHDYVNHAGAPSRACRTTTCCSSTACSQASSATWTPRSARTTTRGADGRPRLHARAGAQPGAGPAGRALSGSQALARMNAELERGFGDAQAGCFHLGLGAGAGPQADRAEGAEPGHGGRGSAHDAAGRAGRRRRLHPRASWRPAAAPARRSSTRCARAWNKDVSGDVQYALKPDWMLASSTSITTHGSPHPYDTHVPILVYGPRWVKPGRVDSRVEVADIAPTLARLLGVPAPSASEGKPLPLAGP